MIRSSIKHHVGPTTPEQLAPTRAPFLNTDSVNQMKSNMNKLPDFIVLGAPKCGTTAVFRYLSSHPEIYIPKVKEEHVFATDMQPQKPYQMTSYRALFDSYQGEQRVGDVGVIYMYSKTAIGEIIKTLGDIQFVCLLRNPVEAVHALHAQLVWGDQEDQHDIGKALDLEKTRAAGKNLPRNLYLHPDLLQYRATFLFGEQLERILKVVPRENLLILFQEDLRKDTPAEARKLFQFLGVDEDAQIKFDVANPNTRVRSPLLQKILFDRASPIRKLGSLLVRNRNLKRAIINTIRKKNSVVAARDPLPRNLKSELCDYFRSDIEKLESICHRNLDHWKVAQAKPSDVGTTPSTGDLSQND